MPANPRPHGIGVGGYGATSPSPLGGSRIGREEVGGAQTIPPPLRRKQSSVTLPKSPFVHFGSNSGRALPGAASGTAVAGLEAAKRCRSWADQAKLLVVGDPNEGPKLLNTLLIALFLSFPAALYSGPATTFTLGFLALIPLAALLGDLTDDLACSLGDTLGAFLNITFGNATEVIICVVAVQHNMFDVIKASMLGSILGNMLLVLGTSFIAAGWNRNGRFSFNRTGVNIYSALLLVSCFSLIVPTALAYFPREGAVPFFQASGGEHVVLLVSRFLSIILVTLYFIFVYYQATNKHHFEDCDDEEAGDPHLGVMEKSKLLGGEEEVEDEEEEPQLSVGFAITALALVTVLISIESELVVQAIEPFAVSSGISKAFIAVILLPIVGNVCEHASAILMALRNKMDISIGVAVGSSIQIATFVIPLLVIVSWFWNGENPKPLKDGGPGALDLNFHPFCTVMLLVSVLTVNTVVNVERGTWITGLFLLLTYIMIAICCWFVPSNVDII